MPKKYFDIEKDETPEVAPVRPPRVRNEEAVEAKTAFKSWFILKLNQDSRLKPHHAESLSVYMNSRGLSDAEPSWRYDVVLREYFGAA
jgi:hypothetical protein